MMEKLWITSPKGAQILSFAPIKKFFFIAARREQCVLLLHQKHRPQTKQMESKVRNSPELQVGTLQKLEKYFVSYCNIIIIATNQLNFSLNTLSSSFLSKCFPALTTTQSFYTFTYKSHFCSTVLVSRTETQQDKCQVCVLLPTHS